MIARDMRLLGTLFLAGLLGVGGALPGHGQALDRASAEALAATLQLLRDPAARAGAIAGSAQAGPIDQQIRAKAGSDAVVQEFYELAAQVFSEIATGLGGDAQKIGEALERGQRDPDAFTALLSPQTRERLRELPGKLSDRRR